MIVDASAVVSVLAQEPDAAHFTKHLGAVARPRMSAATFLEISIVMEGKQGDAGARAWDAFFTRAQIVIEPVTAEQAHIAREAWSRFGKGRHPAGLNYGDCFAYALAKVMGEPILCKGADFSKTDILVVA